MNFSSDTSTYSIRTIKQGRHYRIVYYIGFNTKDIYNSLIAGNISKWNAMKNTFEIQD